MEPLMVFGAAILVWMIAAGFDVFEFVHSLTHDFEVYELDELVLLIFLIGNAGYYYAYRSEAKKNREILLRASAEDELDWLSKHDSLTGLPNRRFLQELLNEKAESDPSSIGTGLGVLSIDLDGFKKANDLLGHSGGDAVLMEVSERLKSYDGIDVAVRQGGDEFLALVDRAKGRDPMDVAEEVRAILCEPVTCDGVTHIIGASIGISYYPEDNSDLAKVVQYADLAMYEIKRLKDQSVVRFEPYMDEASHERAKMETDLLTAMNAGEIRPHYQPLVNLETNAIYGFEALARWTRPGYGPVSPEAFVRVAEDMGVITKLSDDLLRMACLDAKAWPDELILSFNLSPVQLTDPLLGLRITKILDSVDFPPRRLEVEITESALVQDFDRAADILAQLRSIGVKLSLDDFGTGYSNLSQLSKLDFDRLKVDQSFIRNFQSEPKQMAIVKTVLSLGNSLGLYTTAEGIENQEQLKVLQELGCGCGQGYLLGRPVDAAATLEMISGMGHGDLVSVQKLAG
ncbi:putative bifunctional diguanylate cyclase/phosphodiesterase [uncultured Cohaesibacter sp.]|uniref:putative bifunctional diguanylate cyclase/phosphodiesterase n=1 Tax=uncultured Cohaesibacter sp. TaxID=1002546 RepID=UPI00374878E1